MKRIILLLFILILPSSLRAAEFDPNFLLSDQQLTNDRSMTQNAIQAFLEAKGSFLASYKTANHKGLVMKASQIIFEAAKEYSINPQYLLVLLQKEQSLIERRGNPSQKALDWATGYAVCDSCSLSDPSIQKYKGFGKQVDAGAGANRFYIDNPNRFNVKSGIASIIDGQKIRPANQATANQYIYTPHIHGNKNLWTIWQKWWSRTYPNGVVIKSLTDSDLWLIKGDKRHKFSSMGVFSSRYALKDVLEVPPSELLLFDEGAPIKFSNYSLVQSKNGMKFLLVDDVKRPFLTEKTFKQLGYHPDEVISASNEELEEYDNGKFISDLDLFPLGAIVRSPVSGDRYYVHNGEKSPIMSDSIIENRFRNQQVVDIAADQLQGLKLTPPLKFRDGSLVKAEETTTVYVISDGSKRAIPTAEIFENLGWKWENIQTVDRLSLKIHPTGPHIK